MYNIYNVWSATGVGIEKTQFVFFSSYADPLAKHVNNGFTLIMASSHVSDALPLFHTHTHTNILGVFHSIPST